MNAFSKMLSAVFLAIFLWVGPANALVIDFEDGDPAFIRQSQSPDSCIDDFTVYHNGFTFENQKDCGAYYQYFDGVRTDNMSLFFATSGEGRPLVGDARGPSLLEMTRTEGGFFDLLSLDLVIGAEDFVDVFAYRDGVLVYDQVMTIDSGFVQYQQLDFLDVDRIIFSQQWPLFNAIGLDNIEVSVVPLPAAVWLFGSALVGLGWFRRAKA